MLAQARKLRREMTPQERKLWYLFLKNYPVKIYRQRIIESFIVDFYCSSAKLVIELDGQQHFTMQGKQYDAERSQILNSHGLRVIRFTNHDVDTKFLQVCHVIHQAISQTTSIPQ
jgi:very-short-patch-repair endonuclease